jgi:16S rRNA G966 N2-methylase RsmD
LKNSLIDSFYTPPDLAVRLLNHIQTKSISNVVDFCIGDGELLRAALKKWPNIKCFGIDISEVAVQKVKELHSNWEVDQCDFLDTSSMSQCDILKKNKNGFDLILLNPPFSCIGGTIHEVQFEGNIYQASTAMKFLIESIKYLTKDGSLFAIMPVSIAYSQKDKILWKILVENYRLSILESPNGSHFKNCSPNIIFISINDSSRPIMPTDFKKISINGYSISIFRGKASMYTIKNQANGRHIVHSTNLKDNKLEGLNIKVQNILSEVKGPAILIPRVGNPNPNKICIIPRDKIYVLSDCVFAIKTNTLAEAKIVKSILLENWSSLRDLYKGTGARYITKERLSDYLGIKKDF